MSNKSKMLVTSALPYANGPLHLGHMVEHVQSDIWVRFQRLIGRDCKFVCGEDAHGTPIMLKADSQGIKPEELVSQYYTEHQRDLTDFFIEYDFYHTTHSEENRTLASEIYTRLKAKGDIVSRTIEQLFDPEKNMFLPDRYVKGECPKCKTPDQYGDGCEACGAHYSPTELINPCSAISGTTPVSKESEHFFFCLDNYEDLLKNWTRQGHLQTEIANKLDEWFEEGLKQWDISRDAPYFGFEIPDAPGKYFYVWMDAPIGYMASFKKLCDTTGLDFDEYWSADSTAELYHFIGKDIVYFHSLFWPAMLLGAGYRAPTKVFTHGFLTVNGTKMSKSRGTFITARKYLEELKPEHLRYYFAAKLTDTIDDIDLNFNDYVQRINSDLIGKYVNIASRCAGFIHKNFDGKLAKELYDNKIYEDFVKAGEQIAGHYNSRNYSKSVREIMALADKANRFIDEHKPWILIKDPDSQTKVQEVCTTGINLFRLLSIYLSPILPAIAKKVGDFLKSDLSWELSNPLLNHEINKYVALMQRIETSQVEKMIEEQTEPKQVEKNYITIDDFAKVDLRIAKIESAEEVPEADKLLKLILDLGDEKRQVFAGIKAAYKPEDLVGKHTVMVANLAPRQMRFGLSEGMVLAAGPGGKDIWILEPHAGAQPGMKVK